MLNKRDLQSIREVVKEEAGNKVEVLRTEMREGFDGIRLEFAEVIAESVLPKFDEVYERLDKMDDKIGKLDNKVDLIAANTVHKSQFNVMMNDLRRKRKPKNT